MTLAKIIYKKALKLEKGKKLLFPTSKEQAHSIRSMIYQERKERTLKNPSFQDNLIIKTKKEGLEICRKKEINIDDLITITGE